MNRINYIIVILLVFTWVAEDSYHLAPRGFWFTPFLFSDKTVTMQRFIHDLTIHLEYIIFIVCILIRKIKFHWITKDVVIMTIFLKALSMIWYSIKYGNPYYHSEWYVIFVVTLVIFTAIEFEKWNERNHRNNSNNSDLYYRGGDIRF